MNKKRIVTILIVIATVILAGVAIFTAVRLYQLRSEPVAPNVPTSEPDAAGANKIKTKACSPVSFTIAAVPSPSPSSSPGISPSPSPSSDPSPDPSPDPSSDPSPDPSSPSGGGSGATDTPVAATETPELPDAGVSFPTIISAGAGIIVMIISILLAF